MLLSAFLVAWGAEAAQFLISQGLALAILAWVQTLPEFAVEAVIAWEAGGKPEVSHLAIANLTGAIRLLLGLGWPMIYFVFAVSSRRRGDTTPAHITLQPEHAIEVIGLIPPLLYFVVIVWKQTMSWIDAVVLLLLYVAYLAALLRNPPHDVAELANGDLLCVFRRDKDAKRWQGLLRKTGDTWAAASGGDSSVRRRSTNRRPQP